MKKDYQEELDKKYKGEYILKSTYNGYNQPVEILHTKCNKTFTIRADYLLYGKSSCPFCSSKKNGKEKFKKYIDSLNGEFTLVSDYVNDRTKVKIRHNCSLCNNYEWEIRASKFKANPDGKKCPKCNAIKFKEEAFERSRSKVKSNDEFLTEVKNLVGDEYTFLEKYGENRFQKLKVKHNSCGYIYEVKPNDFLQGHRCPKCFHKKSKKEVEVYNFIKELFPSTENTVRNIINGELDIYVPEKKVAIEFDGIFWHNDKHKVKYYHRDKMLEANQKGIRLIHIFEDEWDYKQDIVKSKLKHILGKNTSPVVYARKCTIKEIDSVTKNTFLEKNHIQGADAAAVKLGLYCQDTLVAVMTFCKPRRVLGFTKTNSKKYDYELSRYAMNISYRVVGGFSKMFKYFINKYNPTSIVTYADLRWSSKDSNIYDTTGFTLDHISAISYSYVEKDNHRCSRFCYRKQRIKEHFPEIYNESLTEFQMTDMLGLSRIWDCGNLVYTWKNV